MKNIFVAFIVFFFGIATTPAWAGHVMPKITEITIGDGAEAVPYSAVKVHYTGWLMNGTKFDSSLDRGDPFAFMLGAGQVIQGWELGVQGMRIGGKRELIIPPDLAYGKQGAGNLIPPDSTLKFEVSLLAVEPPKFDSISNPQLKGLLAKGTKIIDVRRPEEWKETGVVEGSKLIMSFDDKGRLTAGFMEGLKQYVGQDEPVILICRTGNRTGYLSNMLSRNFGYSKIYNVQDGMVKWLADGNPVVKP